MPITSTKCHKVEPKYVWAASIPDSEKRNVVVLLYFLHLGPLVDLKVFGCAPADSTSMESNNLL
jgi:hypothetical protein